MAEVTPPRKTYVSNIPEQGTQVPIIAGEGETFHHFPTCLFFDDIYDNKSTLIANRQDLKPTVPLTQSSTDSKGFEIYPSRE